MNRKRIIATTAALGLVLVLAWGCQNSKPVGPMKYVSMKASVSTKGMVKPNQSEFLELLYRVTGPSMNPISGKVTVGIETESVNFTLDVPAGPSRTLAVQINYGEDIWNMMANSINANRTILLGATRFDIDPNTPVVDVPVEIGIMCPYPELIGECYGEGAVAYMGNTDLVNCAFVPNDEAFQVNTCYAKMYFYGYSGPVDTIVGPNAMNTPNLEVGDVYCFAEDGGHTWAQVVGTQDEYMFWIFRTNYSLPYYAFDPEFLCPYFPGIE